jgi:hypothetical protein
MHRKEPIQNGTHNRVAEDPTPIIEKMRPPVTAEHGIRKLNGPYF